MIYYAKSNPVETVEEHTERMQVLCDKLQALYPHLFTERGWEKLRYAIEIHDFGKKHIGFQTMIRNAIKKEFPDVSLEEIPNIASCNINHNCLSPAVINEQSLIDKGWTKDEVIDVACAVYFHHERNSINESILRADSVPFKEDLKEAFKGEFGKLAEEFSGCKPTLRYCGNTQKKFRQGMGEYGQRSLSKDYIMLHGWLNRIDYAASAHLDEVEVPLYDADGHTYAELTRNSLAKYPSYRSVQKYAEEHRGKNIAFIASTGSGKTEAALLWGNGQKLFYTLPVKTAINSMFKRLQNEIGYKPTAVVHSDSLSMYANSKDSDGRIQQEAIQSYASAKQLCSPLTVCTVDQLFTFALGGAGRECKLATLCNSCVVIDEIQSYSPHIIATLIRGLELLKEYGGRFLIMTATLPKIVADRYIRPLLDEPIPPTFHTSPYRRHRIQLRKNADWDDNDLLEELLEAGEEKRVLITVNTVRQAQKLYTMLNRKRNVANHQNVCIRLLHSRFLRKDRNRLEKEIMSFAPNKKEREPNSGIWICTQVVEASLDVDFDMLYTDMCAIESLLQRMGRVYRNRDIDCDGANVIILDAQTGVPYIMSQSMYDFSLRAVESVDGMLLEESDQIDLKSKMMDTVYDPEINPEIEREYFAKIKKELELLRAISPHSLDETSIRKEFRDITSYTIIPLRIYNELVSDGKYDEWEKKIKTAKGIERKMLIDEVYEHTISVSHLDYSARYMSEEFLFEGSGIHVSTFDYDSDMGLIVNNKNKDVNDEFRAL